MYLIKYHIIESEKGKIFFILKLKLLSEPFIFSIFFLKQFG